MPELFSQIVILSFVASTLLYLAHRLGQSVIVAYIIAGVFLGPFGFSIIKDPDQIKWLSELGIILLMFTVGTEFGQEQRTDLNKKIIFVGVLQIGLSILAGWGLGQFFGLLPGQGLFLGGVLALSSTAIVMKFLSDHGSLETVQAKSLYLLAALRSAKLPVKTVTSTLAHVWLRVSVLRTQSWLRRRMLFS